MPAIGETITIKDTDGEHYACNFIGFDYSYRKVYTDVDRVRGSECFCYVVREMGISRNSRYFFDVISEVVLADGKRIKGKEIRSSAVAKAVPVISELNLEIDAETKSISIGDIDKISLPRVTKFKETLMIVGIVVDIATITLLVSGPDINIGPWD